MIYNNCSGICYACRTNNNIFGAICGDILGSTFEFEKKKYNNISEIDLPKSILTVGSSVRGLVREKRYKDTYN